MIIKIKQRPKATTFLRSTLQPRSSVFITDENRNRPRVSFCIPHKNRFQQLAHTLPKNLEDNRLDSARIEFVLADFGSDEDISGWIAENFSNEIESGYLKYFQVPMAERWNAPFAKNVAHRLGSGQILVNLDGDNFTGYRGGQFVLDLFMSSPHDICCWQFSGFNGDGSFGRIALARDSFYKLGGYNEELLEMGYQDRDLVTRMEIAGAKVVLAFDEAYNRTLENEQYEPKGMTYATMRETNKRLAQRVLLNDNLVANRGLAKAPKGRKRMIFNAGKCEMIDV